MVKVNKLIIWENVLWILFLASSMIFCSFLLASCIVPVMFLNVKVLATIYISGGLSTSCLFPIIILGRKIDKIKKCEVKENGI